MFGEVVRQMGDALGVGGVNGVTRRAPRAPEHEDSRTKRKAAKKPMYVRGVVLAQDKGAEKLLFTVWQVGFAVKHTPNSNGSTTLRSISCLYIVATEHLREGAGVYRHPRTVGGREAGGTGGEDRWSSRAV